MDAGGRMDDRRSSGDRREGAPPTGGGRRGAKRTTSPLTYVLRALGAVVILLGVIVYAVRVTRPVYATRGTLGEELRKHAPEVAAVLNPADSTAIDQFVQTPKFEEEKRNFFEDVMRLKQVDSARADSIAHFAVREAYRRGISPAIIFGVMLTENSRFVSNAKSNVGAVGLMQVYPKIWLTKEMTKLFGRDLSTDSTNVKYGVFILNQYFRPKDKKGQVRDRDWATALLRYNGCVNGTNTPRCHTYPSKVKGFIENQGTSICNGRGFYDCIAKPFINGLLGGSKDSSSTPATSTAPPATAPVAATVQQAAEPIPSPPPTPLAVPAAAPKATPPAAEKASTRSSASPVTRKPSPKKAVAKKPAPKKRTTTTRKPRASRAEPDIPPPPKPITIKVP
ncbi:MAG TPA: transglycosylase SLT domain-containing protein [Gemmatimonadaceae bacterium]|nr:transglycosylase SLT domain-containing protein [Gemmatimonadaceae bacterium]